MDVKNLLEGKTVDMNWADMVDEILRQNFYATRHPAHSTRSLGSTRNSAPSATLGHPDNATADPELA